MNYNERKAGALLLIKQDRYPEALEELGKLFKENPKDPEVLTQIAYIFNRIQEAHLNFEPRNAEEYTMRGVAHFYHSELDESIDDFNKALQADPRFHYALKCRAFSYRFLGMLKEASEDLHKAITICPLGEYFDDLAENAGLLGDHAAAISYHEKAIEYSPQDARLWYNYGVHLYETGRIKEAIKKYDKAIEIWPQYDDALHNRQFILENHKHLL